MTLKPRAVGFSDVFRTVLVSSWRSIRRSLLAYVPLLIVSAALAVVLWRAARATSYQAAPIAFTVVAAAALVVVMFAPIHFRIEGIIDSARIALLPISARTRFLLGALFGGGWRAMLALIVFVILGVAMGGARLHATARLLETAQLGAWTVAAILAGRAVEESLRRRPSVVAFGVTAGALVAAILVLRFAPRGMVWLSSWQELGSGSGVAAAALLATRAAAGAELVVLVGAVWGTVLFVRLASSRLVRPLTGVATSVLLRRIPSGNTKARAFVAKTSLPATVAKELAAIWRVRAFWMNHAWVLICSAPAFSAGTPQLLVAAFLLWMIAAYNLLGPDVPVGGLTRYSLLPRSLARALILRHAAILCSVAMIAIVSLAFVAVVGAVRKTPDAPGYAAHLTWFLYGASLLLLVTVTGDWTSQRVPHAIGRTALVQSVSSSSMPALEFAFLVALAGTFTLSVLLVLMWSVVFDRLSVGADGVVSLAALVAATVTQTCLYGWSVRDAIKR